MALVERGPGWEMHRGDALEVMQSLTGIDHVVTDPPYGEHVHRNGVRQTPEGNRAAVLRRRNNRVLPDVAQFNCRRRRSMDLGFESLDPNVRRVCSDFFAALARRWTLVFSDTEGADGWRADLVRAGLDFVRYGFWVKDRAMPQLTGDRPGSRVEQITIAHPRGRKKWNGGGTGNVWQWPVVANCAGHRSDRVHTAQKPIGLMLELLELFTSPGDLVLDPFTGSGTTGVAALRLGRRFIGIERDAAHFATACDRLRAENVGSTLSAVRAGQVALFGGRT